MALSLRDNYKLLIFFPFAIVISYVEESDVDIAEEIEEVVSNPSMSFDSVFSRNKMLRRRINRKKKIGT